MFDVDLMDRYIVKQMEEQNIPGLSIVFSDASGIVFDRAYGYRDGKREKPVDGDTIMGVASLSKSVTALCVALLEHEGKLSMEDPVTRFFPRFKIPGVPKDAVLIKHLLSHTTGLPLLPTLTHCMAKHTVRDPGEKWAVDKLDRLIEVDTVDDIIDYIVEGDYETVGQPGEYTSYSNDCYAILSSVVDQAAGMSIEEYMDKKVFQPLGMTRSALGYDRLSGFDNVTQVFTKGEDGQVTASDNWSIAPPYRGCGWIISSSRDMHKYYKMLSQNGVFEGQRILPESVVDRLLGNDFPTLKTSVYAYGLGKVLCRGEVLFSHAGSLKGVASAGAFFKDRGVAGTVLTNMGGVDAVRILMGAFNIAQGHSPEEHTHNFVISDRPPQEPWIYEGFYGAREHGMSIYAYPYKVARENGKLVLTLAGDEKRPLVYCGENYFLAPKDANNPLRDCMFIKFYVRNDKAWALQTANRMYQRI